MANLNETPTWEPGVYQLEEEDLVQGGPDGIDNAQAKQLGNRTLYLKQQLEAAVDEMTAHLAAADPHTQYATEVWVAGQIASLINAAPGALDTLNELAEAMGDDPNFAATVTNALALKAPLASPVLTGNPTAPTPAQFDASTKLATMEAMQRALGNTRSHIALAANTTLTAADAGKTFNIGGATASLTATLPLAADCPNGARFTFICLNVNALTVSRQGADLIYGSGDGSTSIVLRNGESLVVEKSAATWVAVDGSGKLSLVNSFLSSLLGNGYQKLPGGLIFQWGQFDASASVSGTTTFPIAFTNNLFSLTFGTGSASSTAAPYCTSSNTASFTWNRGSSGSVQGRYFAIGI